MASVQAEVTSEERNWAELPQDILTLIFQELGSIEILFTAQAVCSSWMRLAYDPHMWRYVDMRNPWHLYDSEYDLEKMARHAVDRSNGELVEFSMEYFGTDDLLMYAADRTSVLRCLRLVSCYSIMDDVMIEALSKFPLLEELELSYCSFTKEVLESAGRLCPRLKSLQLNNRGYKRPHIECDEEATAIAENMPELRNLQLFGNKLTNAGLQAIFEGCPHLESLDLRQCFNITLEGSLLNICMDRIKDLRRPDDSTDDYGFCAEINGDSSSDEDYPFGFSEIDSYSDYGCYEFSDESDFEDLGFRLD